MRALIVSAFVTLDRVMEAGAHHPHSGWTMQYGVSESCAYELERNPGGGVAAAGPGDLRGVTSAWSPGDAEFADKMNGDAGAPAYTQCEDKRGAVRRHLHHPYLRRSIHTVQGAQAGGWSPCSGVMSGEGRGSLV